MESFFLAAFRKLGGTVREREPRRYEVSHVPAAVRTRGQQVGRGDPVLQRYERIAFEKQRLTVAGRPPAALVCPGHPLLDAVLDLTLERNRGVLQQGAVLVDERDPSLHPRVLYTLEHAIRDAQRTISQRMLYVEDRCGGQQAASAPSSVSGLSPTRRR